MIRKEQKKTKTKVCALLNTKQISIGLAKRPTLVADLQRKDDKGFTKIWLIYRISVALQSALQLKIIIVVQAFIVKYPSHSQNVRTLQIPKHKTDKSPVVL